MCMEFVKFACERLEHMIAIIDNRNVPLAKVLVVLVAEVVVRQEMVMKNLESLKSNSDFKRSESKSRERRRSINWKQLEEP